MGVFVNPIKKLIGLMCLEFFLLLLIAIFIAFLVYKKRNRTPTKFIHFHSKAIELDLVNKHMEAIGIRKEALRSLEGASNAEKADLYVGIGWNYMKLGDLVEATNFFDKAFETARDERFPYDKQYEEILETYVQAGRRDKAVLILEDLLSRQSYDKKFKRLENYRVT